MEYINLIAEQLAIFWAWTDFGTVAQFWLYGIITNIISFFLCAFAVTIKLNNCTKREIEKYYEFCDQRAEIIMTNNRNKLMLCSAMILVPFHNLMLFFAQIWNYRKAGYNGLVDGLVGRDRMHFVQLIKYKPITEDNK